MSSLALVRYTGAIAWELRQAWATGVRVSLRIQGDSERIEGTVRTVSPTDAYVVVAGLHVPLERVLGVYRPSLLGESDWREGEDWSGPPPPSATCRFPGQLMIPGLDWE